MSKNYCDLCSKNCKFGEEECTDDEQEIQHQRLVNVVRGG